MGRKLQIPHRLGREGVSDAVAASNLPVIFPIAQTQDYGRLLLVQTASKAKPLQTRFLDCRLEFGLRIKFMFKAKNG